MNNHSDIEKPLLGQGHDQSENKGPCAHRGDGGCTLPAIHTCDERVKLDCCNAFRACHDHFCDQHFRESCCDVCRPKYKKATCCLVSWCSSVIILLVIAVCFAIPGDASMAEVGGY